MNIFGAKKAAFWLSENFYKVQLGAKITDIGCGPGSLLRSFENIFPSNIEYHGIDPSKDYILSAKSEFDILQTFITALLKTSVMIKDLVIQI